MNYEQSLEKLSEIVKKVDDKNLPLDEALKLLKEGIEVSKECISAINEAKGTVTLLNEELGKVTEQEFDLNE